MGSAPQRKALTPPDPVLVAALIERFLEEDRGSGDITSEGLVPAQARARARLVGRARGVLAGLDLFAAVFRACDGEARVELDARDGERVEAGQELARIEGNARALLLAERTALNLLQRLSGIATRTARLVSILSATPGVRLLDTRKTTPGLRVLEKYAVRCGGGENHRHGLDDQAMIKENHLALAGCGVREAVERLRASIGPRVVLTCEARTDREALLATQGGADVVLLDNMPPETMAALVPRLREAARERGRPVELEASGGVTEENLLAVARSGIDRISVGALTHSAPALDLSLYLEPSPQGEEGE